MSGTDTPVILQQGARSAPTSTRTYFNTVAALTPTAPTPPTPTRHNALHVAAKLGREEAARMVLQWITSGDLLNR